jgi:predicted rRNA methylase YqxC with S4 and FtsJ domains
MKTVYEVIMVDGHSSETCSMGICETREKAEALIQEESVQYNDHMIFEIEEKYIRG